MKILHTADWHLGQKFFHRNREEEHKAALDWLAEFIIAEGVELLIVAGDIFDTDSPPNYARKLYFDFLKRLINTCCEDIVIIAGNHDSANMIDAAKELFKLLNVHIVGHITDDRKSQIIEIRGANNGPLKAVVGAVPYLRDKDIRKSVSGEDSSQRLESLRSGVKQHYNEIETELKPYKKENIPVIVTGHLYASGGERVKDRPNSIHLAVGSLGVIDNDSFSEDFDYVALGHLHREQSLDKNKSIWYSGALIPLDFSEHNIPQAVRLVEFKNKEIFSQKSIKVPLKRKIRHYTGNLEHISKKLENLDMDVELETWLRLDVETTSYSPNLHSDLEELIKGKPAEIITSKQLTAQKSETDEDAFKNLQSLQDLEEIEVFRMRAEQKGKIEEEELTELENSFKELLGWMQERDVE